MDEINWFNDCYSDMFSVDFESLFPTVDLKSFSHFVIDTIIIITGNRISCHTILGGNHARNFKSVQLLPE